MDKLKKNHFLLFRVLWILLCVSWVAFIFSNSAQSATDSSMASEGIRASFNALLARIGISVRLSPTVIRKLAHFTEYAVLGILLLLGTCLYDNLQRRYWYPIPVGLLVACIDEGIQSFFPGRGPSIFDVAIDLSGICFVLLLLFFLRSLRKRRIK